MEYTQEQIYQIIKSNSGITTITEQSKLISCLIYGDESNYKSIYSIIAKNLGTGGVYISQEIFDFAKLKELKLRKQ